MIVAAAQIRSISGDLKGNLEKHLAFAELAADRGVELLFFPELSLTNYEPTIAKQFASGELEDSIARLHQFSRERQLAIAAGAPKQTDRGIEIAMLWFLADGELRSYSKQILHCDEKPYFVEGVDEFMLYRGGIRVVPAICYESLQPEHLRAAKINGPAIYLVSVAKSAAGTDKAEVYYAEASRQNRIPIIVANNLGPADNFIGAGRSAVWNQRGEKLGQLSSDREQLLVYDTSNESVGIIDSVH